MTNKRPKMLCARLLMMAKIATRELPSGKTRELPSSKKCCKLN